MNIPMYPNFHILAQFSPVDIGFSSIENSPNEQEMDIGGAEDTLVPAWGGDRETEISVLR